MRAIFQASAVMGLGSLVSIGLGILGQKYLAVMLGPVGVGLLGLLNSALAVGMTLFSLGLGTSGIRQIAVASGGGRISLERTAGALTLGTHVLGAIGAVTVIFAGDPIAAYILGEHAPSGPLLLALGAATYLSVISLGVQAVLNGLSRIRALATVKIASALGGLLALLVGAKLWGTAGLSLAIAVPPLTGWGVSVWLSRDVRWREHLVRVRDFVAPMRKLLGLGLVFAASGLVTTGTQFAARMVVQDRLGADLLGQYQAGVNISTGYLGVLLGALAAEYYPRLSTIASDNGRLNTALEAQSRFLLLLIAPAVLMLILAAPAVVKILYTSRFTETVTFLRLQLIGDILKAPVWAIGFLLLAREARRFYFILEVVGNASYLLFLAFLLPSLGLPGAGLAQTLTYAIGLLLSLRYARRETDLRPSAGLARLLGALLLSAAAVTTFAALGESAFLLGLGITVVASVYCLLGLRDHLKPV